MNEDKSTRYHRLKRRATVLATLTGAALLVLLVMTPASDRLRDFAMACVRAAGVGAAKGSVPVVALYVVWLVVINELLEVPFAFYSGYVLERRYDLSTQTVWRWGVDHLKSGAVGLSFAVVAACIVYGIIGLSPRWWWAIAAAVLSVAVVGLANAAPVLLLPLFYRFDPLDRESLRQRLVTLAERAGTRVMGVYEWRLGDRTRKANAALTGLGRTRRIIVSDTLLADHSDDEIEVILAHELGHHVHGDIWKALAWEAALLFAGLYAANAAMGVAVPRLGLDGMSDVAGLPVLLLAVGILSVLLMPVVHALSRAHERRADRFALDLTGNAPAFVSAMKRIGARNLAEERPSTLAQWLFYSHPPIAARVAAAEAWRARGSTDQSSR